MVDLCIRRVVIQVDEIHHEMGKKIDPPTRKATAAAAIINPYAGNYKENLEPLYDLGAEIGGYLARRAVSALGVKPSDMDAAEISIADVPRPDEIVVAVVVAGTPRPLARVSA